MAHSPRRSSTNQEVSAMFARRLHSRSLVTTALPLALLLFVPTGASGQRPSKPDSMQAQLEQASAMMGPMMGQMMEAMMEGMLRVLSKPENAERLAAFTRNYYDALVRKGFTKDEALQIVIAAGMPRVPTGPR